MVTPTQFGEHVHKNDRAYVARGMRACIEQAERHREAALLLVSRKYHEQAVFLLASRLEEYAKAIMLLDAAEGGSFGPIDERFWEQWTLDERMWALAASEIEGLPEETGHEFNEMADNHANFKRFILHAQKTATGFIAAHHHAGAQDIVSYLCVGDALGCAFYKRLAKSIDFPQDSAQNEIPRPTWLNEV